MNRYTSWMRAASVVCAMAFPYETLAKLADPKILTDTVTAPRAEPLPLEYPTKTNVIISDQHKLTTRELSHFIGADVYVITSKMLGIPDDVVNGDRLPTDEE